MDPIPASVERFLHANIDSVDQLEILRLLASDPQRLFAAAELAHERQITPQDIERHLTMLDSRGLITITAQQPLACKHGARTPEIQREVELLARTYLERPVSLIRMLYEHEKQLRLFAEAFRLKGDK